MSVAQDEPDVGDRKVDAQPPFPERPRSKIHLSSRRRLRHRRHNNCHRHRYLCRRRRHRRCRLQTTASGLDLTGALILMFQLVK